VLLLLWGNTDNAECFHCLCAMRFHAATQEQTRKPLANTSRVTAKFRRALPCMVSGDVSEDRQWDTDAVYTR
jgi:hypothetical protein